MRRFIAFFALLGFLLVACGLTDDKDNCNLQTIPSVIPTETVRVYKMVINADVPSAKIGPIVDATSEWVTVTDGKFVFEVKYADFDPAKTPEQGEIRVYLAPKADPKSSVIGSATWWGADVNGRPNRAIIWIQNDLDDRTHYLVAMHEVGHSLGLSHSEIQPSIMWPSITDPGDHPPCNDRKSICKIWECDPACQ